MARDRKRAKQRQQRRRGPGRAHPTENGHEQGGPQLTRADLPAALGHTGDVDEFDAALVRGAEGVPVPDDADVKAAEIKFSEEAPDTGNGAGELAPAAGDGGRGVTTAPVRAPARPAREQQSLPRRAIAFLRASWAELQRVQWPNRAQTTQATAVVLGFVAVAGVYFGVADYVAKEIVEAIL